MDIEKAAQIRTTTIFRVEIYNSWWIDDFNDAFDSINRLYVYYSVLTQAYNELNRLGSEVEWNKKYKNLPVFHSLSDTFNKIVFNIFNSYRPSESISRIHSIGFTQVMPPQIASVKFGSKGAIDILGFGQIFEIIKELIINYVPSKDKKVDTLLKEKELEEKEQKIIQMKIDNLKKLGLENEDILAILGFESLHLSRIRKLVEQKKITGFNLNKFSEQ